MIDALAVHNLEFGLLKGRRNLVLDHLDTGFVTDHLIAFFDSPNAAYIQTNRGIKLQRVTARGSLRTTKHHANFHSNLIDKDNQGI